MAGSFDLEGHALEQIGAGDDEGMLKAFFGATDAMMKPKAEPDAGGGGNPLAELFGVKPAEAEEAAPTAGPQEGHPFTKDGVTYTVKAGQSPGSFELTAPDGKTKIPFTPSPPQTKEGLEARKQDTEQRLKAAEQRPGDVLLANSWLKRQKNGVTYYLAPGDIDWTEKPPADARTTGEAAKAIPGVIGRDIRRGAIEALPQALKGTIAAVNETLDLSNDLTNWLDEHVADVDAGRRADAQIPDPIPEAASVTGGSLKSITQFMLGFVGAGKLMPVLKAAKGASAAEILLKSAGKGAFADVLAFDEHQARLSNMLADNPELQIPVAMWLAADPTDGVALGKAKQAIEGVVGGTIAEGLIMGLGAFRASRIAKIRQQREEAGLPADGSRPLPLHRALPAEALHALGDPEAPLVVTVPRSKAEQQIADMLGGKLDTAYRVTGGAEEDAARVTADRLTANMARLPVRGAEQVYINFARINASADIKQVMATMADAMKPEIDEARRGVVTHEMTKAEAAQLDAFNVLAGRRKGQPLNDSETLVLRQLHVASAQKLMEVAELATNVPLPENELMFRRMVSVHEAIQLEVTASKTEQARALQANRIPVGEPGDTERAKAVTDALMSYEGSTKALAARIASLKGHPELAQELDKFVEKSLGAKTVDAVRQAWYAALLSTPVTHVVNTMSNAVFLTQNVMERAAARSIALGMKGESAIEAGEGSAMFFAGLQAQKDALRYGAKAALTGESGFGLNQIEVPRQANAFAQAFEGWTQWGQQKLGMTPKGLDPNNTAAGLAKFLDATTAIPGRALLGGDEYFKTLGYRAELAAQAVRVARGEVRTGQITEEGYRQRVAEIIADPPEHLIGEARDFARYVTFTSQPGENLKKLLALRQNAGLWVFMPFVSTPANLTMRTFERTPLAPLSGRWRADMAAGGARRELAIARASTGTAISSVFLDYAMRGLITGEGPSDPGERQQWLRTHQPNSVKIGENWVALDRIEPLGAQLRMAAMLGEYLGNADMDDEKSHEDILQATSLMAFAAMNGIVSKTYMQGTADFLQAIEDPDRYGQAWSVKFVSSFVPGGSAAARRAVDPAVRYASDTIEAMKNRVPGLSQGLPAISDVFGRPRLYSSGLGAVYDLLSPFRVRKDVQEPVDRELERLSKAGVDYDLTMPQSFSEGGFRVSKKTEPRAYWRYVALAGNEAKDPKTGKGMRETVNDLVEGKGDFTIRLDGQPVNAAEAYRSAKTDWVRADILKKTVTWFRGLAKDRIIAEMPALQEGIDSARAQKAERRGQTLAPALP